MSPFEIIMGMEPRTPLALFLDTNTLVGRISLNLIQDSLAHGEATSLDHVKRYLMKKGMKLMNYEVGDLVLLKNIQNISVLQKLRPNAFGPFRIVGKKMSFIILYNLVAAKSWSM